MKNRDNSSLSRYQKHYETQTGYPAKTLSSETKLSDCNRDTRLRLGTRNFLKHKTVPYNVFLQCETKTFQWKIVIPSLCLDTGNMEHDSPTRISGNAKRISDEKS